MSAPVRVVVADDHPLLRDGVARSLDGSGRFTVVGQGGSADDAVRLVGEHKPDLVLLDLSMPGGGIWAARRIAAEAPEVKIVVLTVSEADDDIMEALKAGAKGYVLKGVGSATLVDILGSVADGESYVSPSLAARLLTEMRTREPRGAAAAGPLSQLSKREEEILRLVARGYEGSPRPYPERVEEPWYDADHAVRRVRPAGEIKWNGSLVFVSEALAGEPVGLAETEAGNWIVRFCDTDLGLLDRGSNKLRRFAAARPGRGTRTPEQTGETVTHVSGP